MAHFPLASNSDWELTNDDQDIRGWEARDGANNLLGQVASLLMNPKTERVEVVRLDTGREIAVADVRIADSVVYCDIDEARPPAATEPASFGRLTRRAVPNEPSFVLYQRIFRDHYASHFIATGWVYEFYAPGYRFGHGLAFDPSNAQKSYDQIEPKAREDFVARFGADEYQTHREAIRYGYEQTRLAEEKAKDANTEGRASAAPPEIQPLLAT